MTNLTPLRSPYNFDLTKHGWIEASAGSGKTYTIERLYLRAIIECNVSTDQILAVTFTEKAASELKDRIRNILQNLVNNDFDENDANWNRIKTSIGEDTIRQRANHAIFHFDEAAIFTIHGFCQSVLNEFGFDMGRQLQYKLVDDSIIIDNLIAQKFRQLTGELAPDSSVACFLKEQKVSLVEILKDIEFWKPGSFDRSDDYKFDSVLRQFVKMDRTIELRLSDFSDNSPIRFLAAMAEDIRQELQSFKLHHSYISYDDMIYHVQDGLTNQPDLAKQIASRFQFAIIDEFQDTDSVQWQIFKSCFIESTAENRLILVGDPKQSIYGFRGADLNSYFFARQELLELQRNQKANLYQIVVNYRSTESLIEAANSIFSSQEYPWNQEIIDVSKKIEFQPAQAPKSSINQKPLPKDLKPFQLFKSPTDARTKPKFYSEYSKYIVNEIQYLVNSQTESNNNFDYSDIGILVPTKKDATYILSKLESEAIPATFYKQIGVFQSREAFEILYILEALAEPNYAGNLRKALLTRFFGRNLSNVADLSIDDPLYQRFQDWVDLALNQKWPQLFRSMLTIDEFISAAVDNSTNWQRWRTNYEQIFEYLVERLLSNRSDIVGAIATMKELMREDSLPEEDTIHRQDTDQPRVKVMTIHASKGLEFSVVFIFGGLTKGNQISNFIFYENGKRVFLPNPYYTADKIEFDLIEKNKEKNKIATYKDKHNNHQISEWARLYYVAITRAKQFCYLPFFNGKGPVGSFIYRILIEMTKTDQPNFNVISDIQPKTITIKQNQKTAKNNQTPKFEPPLLPANIWQRKIDLISFSSLSHSEQKNNDFYELAADDEVDQKKQILESSIISEEAVNELPESFGGTIFGNAIHDVLENLNFQDSYFELTFKQIKTEALSESLDTLLSKSLQEYNLTDDLAYRIQLGQMFYQLMNAEILPNLQLKNLMASDRLHELGFLFYSGGSNRKSEPHFMNGLIDLVFRHQGKIYLLDWKTNHLPAYNQTTLSTTMKNSQYDLQYQVYTRAVQGWLKDHGLSKSDFGGVVYLFVRGVRIGSTNGIYFVSEAESYG